MTKKAHPAHDELLEETKTKLLRALADFDNFRKRAAVEKEELTRYSNENMARALLPVLDGLEKAAAFGKGSGGELEKGVALVLKQMKDALAKFGVKEIEAVGRKFDPNLHEAIMMRGSDTEPGTVIEEVQKGYEIHGRLLRPSMVIVSKNKEEK